MARPTKKKIRVIKRDDKTYKGIESFEDYELTYDVAYEMLIRNNEFQNILNELCNDEITLNDFYCKVESFGIIYFENLYLKYDFINKNAKEKILELCKLEETVIVNNCKIRRHDELVIDSKYKEWIGTPSYSFGQANQVLIDDFCFTKENNLKSLKNTYNFFDSTVVQRPIRPKLEIKELNINTNIIFNMSLPKKELVAYLEKIKDDFDKFNFQKAPIELFGEKLEKADNLICDSKGKCFDSRKTLSKQEKVADMFYIYDCLKLGMTQRKIQNEVYNYYANKGKEDRTLDAGTLRKYRSIAIDYIDNMKYKELITGVKQA